jgi:hypothetical protein
MTLREGSTYLIRQTIVALDERLCIRLIGLRYGSWGVQGKTLLERLKCSLTKLILSSRRLGDREPFTEVLGQFVR